MRNERPKSNMYSRMEIDGLSLLKNDELVGKGDADWSERGIRIGREDDWR